MSYCRFSCDDFQSDVYAYYGDSGYVLHIAANRRQPPPGEPRPKMPGVFEYEPVEWSKRYDEYNRQMERTVLVPLELPEAGKCYSYDTAQELYVKLVQLRADGYYVPDHAFTFLMQDIKAEEDGDE